jgi:hypothetical protein
MRILELTLHDDRKVLVNADRVSYVVPLGGNTSIPLTRIVMGGNAEPIDVRETQIAISRLLQGGTY